MNREITANPSATLDLLSNAVCAATHWKINGPLLIGRTDADIELNVAAVSRRHALVAADSASYLLTDLGSRNGTALNGVMLEKHSVPLGDGDVIVLGGAVKLKFHDPMATPIVPRVGKLDGLWIDSSTRDVWIDAQHIDPPLSPHQYALLQLLDQADGQYLQRDEIIQGVWTNSVPDGVSNEAVDSLVKRLRRRLAEFGTNGPVIEVKRYRGVRCRPE